MTLFSALFFPLSRDVSRPRRARTRPPRQSPEWFQPLESRALLSAVIQVTGNGTPIANHDITPSIDDFTDFGPMSTTFNAAIGRVMRSFVIADTGDAPLSLIGGTKQIKITGANARDFALTANSASTIDAGTTSAFTITFSPKGSGLRRATVSIFSNDPAAPAFTFNIQGTAARTTNSANGLQVATLTKGTGPAAVNGAAILVNYTGFLLTSKFESSLDPGGTPVDLRLGISNVIPGWTQGLAGIKAGETRLLVMPAALAYGADAHNNIAPPAPRIFRVTATTWANPVIVVSGNDQPIAFNDKTPTSADGTFLGATPPGSLVPLAFTFKIANGSDGLIVFPLAPVVVITGKNSGSFSASDITIDPTSTFANFTVTYQPSAKAGTQSAIVHVRSSDPAHKDFTFTVAATTSPFLDFSPTSVGTIKLPASGTLVAGNQTSFSVPVTVANLGNASVPGQTPPLQFTFYFHDTTAGTDTLISTQSVTSLRGTGSSKSKTVNLRVPVPGTIPSGSYQVLVRINENAAVTEMNSSNNSVLSGQMIMVTP